MGRREATESQWRGSSRKGRIKRITSGDGGADTTTDIRWGKREVRVATQRRSDATRTTTQEKSDATRVATQSRSDVRDGDAGEEAT